MKNEKRNDRQNKKNMKAGNIKEWYKQKKDYLQFSDQPTSKKLEKKKTSEFCKTENFYFAEVHLKHDNFQKRKINGAQKCNKYRKT